MIYYLVVGLASAISFTVIVIQRDRFYILVRRTVELLNGMLSQVDDQTKQRILVTGLSKVLTSLLMLVTVCAVAMTMGGLLIYVYSLLAQLPYTQMDLASGYFFLSLSIGSAAPFVPIILKRPESGYSETAKLLHRIVLDNGNLSKALFNLEKKLYAKKLLAEQPDCVIVSGLARAGTTAITTQLHELGNFHSLSYANMPFLLAPNIWATVYHPKDLQKRERAHGDSVQFGLDSVEALEEYFWKTSLDDIFVTHRSLNEHEVGKEVYEDYLQYQKLVNRKPEGTSVYLAKNNNMMLRYGSLRKSDENFHVILMFRKPLAQANSLLHQHRKFTEMQTNDPFILEYMNWLGHHEFGHGQKQFKFEGSIISSLDRMTIDYWLEVWIDYYTSVEKYTADGKLILISYEDYLNDPSGILAGISNKLGIEFDLSDIRNFQQRPKDPDAVTDRDLLNQAESLYESMYVMSSNSSMGLGQ